MSRKEKVICFEEKELKGSRLRCLMLTSQPPEQVASSFTSLVQGYATITAKDHWWMPRGFLQPEEAKLPEAPRFLSEADRKTVTGWWLAVTHGANMPNWDIVSTCQIGGNRGLLLVEAKAHEDELNVTTDNCTSENAANKKQIAEALKEANEGLATIVPGWSLSSSRYYQLSNRFAWAWKVASLGVPVILVYLGFLNAMEMNDGKRRILTSARQWRECVRSRSKGIVPSDVWDSTLMIKNVPLIVLVGSVEVNVRSS